MPSHNQAVTRHFEANLATYIGKESVCYADMCEARFAQIAKFVAPDRAIAALDVGCGGGVFIDRFLDQFPQATSFGIDFSSGMLAKNEPHDRKRLVCADAQHPPFTPSTFDLINVEALMHHLVEPGGYRDTMSSILKFLTSARRMLKPGGALAVREIYHEDRLTGSLAPRLIYEVSRRQLPAICTGILRRRGLTTAGVGVAFLSRRQWPEMFSRAGFVIVDLIDIPWPHRWTRPGLRSGDLFYLCRIR